MTLENEAKAYINNLILEIENGNTESFKSLFDDFKDLKKRISITSLGNEYVEKYKRISEYHKKHFGKSVYTLRMRR
jgi:hypothetical protein